MDAAALTKEADALALAKAIDHMLVEALQFANNNPDIAIEALAIAWRP